MRFLLAVFSLSIVTAANAQDQAAICKIASDYAETIMISRQDGVSESVVVKGADAVPAGSRDIALWIMIKAYEKPLFDQAEERENAITSFGEEIYAECMKSG